jgi:hypothetical protein
VKIIDRLVDEENVDQFIEAISLSPFSTGNIRTVSMEYLPNKYLGLSLFLIGLAYDGVINC